MFSVSGIMNHVACLTFILKPMFKSQKSTQLIESIANRYKVPKIELNTVHLAGYTDALNPEEQEELFECKKCRELFTFSELEDGLCDDCIELIELDNKSMQETYDSLTITER